MKYIPEVLLFLSLVCISIAIACMPGCVTEEEAALMASIVATELIKDEPQAQIEPAVVEPVINPAPVVEPKPVVKPNPVTASKKEATNRPKSNGMVVEGTVENRPGRANGNRQHFFFRNRKNQYPDFIIYYGNKSVSIKNNKDRVSFLGDGLVKQSDTRPGMAILLPAKLPDYDTIYIRYRR